MSILSTKYQKLLSLLDQKGGGGGANAYLVFLKVGSMAPSSSLPCSYATAMSIKLFCSKISKIHFMKILTWITLTWFDPVLKFVILKIFKYFAILPLLFHPKFFKFYGMIWFFAEGWPISPHLLMQPNLMVTDRHTHSPKYQ